MKKKSRFSEAYKIFKHSMVTIHHLVWGKGWKKFVFAVVVTLIFLAVFMTITLEVTSTPKFCSVCHNMKPYYKSWRQSSHKDVTCTDCHFPPGFTSKIKGKFTALSMLVNYFTGIYKRGKPWAEISDKSCMRGGCHDTRMLSGPVTYKKCINFAHKPHLENLRRGKKLRCTGCHSQIVQGDHISVTSGTCFLCHFKNVEGDAAMSRCLMCHQLPVKTGSGARETTVLNSHKMALERQIACQQCHSHMVSGDGSVPKNRCNNCHAETDKLKHYDDSALIHKNHITDHKIECDRCHTELQHKSVSGTQLVKPSCRGCHSDFHSAQLALFTGKGGKGLPEHPDSMFKAGLNCGACHRSAENEDPFGVMGQTKTAGPESCVQCHGKGYDTILANWIEHGKRKIAQLEKVLTKAGKTLPSYKKHQNYEAARQKLEDARYNLKLVSYGLPVHNISFSNKLLDNSHQMAEESLSMVGAPLTLPHYEGETGLVPGQCSNCHAGIERKVGRVFGWRFPHMVHLTKEKLACTHCHSNETTHGRMTLKKPDCMSCHHKSISGVADDKDKQRQCKSCHATQSSVYFSQLNFSTLKIPNVMFESVSCMDCHQDESGKQAVVRPGKKSCSNCHEAEYEEMFEEWMRAGLEGLKRLKEKVKTKKLKRGDFAYDILILLQRDGSKGIHNPELYENLIDEALKK